MQNYIVFTMVFGSHYIELFKRACFKSLNWPKNQNALKGREWHIFTTREHFDELDLLFSKYPFKLCLHELQDMQPIPGCGMVPTKQCDSGVVLLNGLKGLIAHCIKNQVKMLFAPPDTIFGDGTVGNLVNIGSVPTSCVAVAHPRVLPGILEELDVIGATRGGLSNAELVTLSFKHAHDSWKLSEIGHPKSRSIIGGIAWKQIDTGLYSVQHRLPTHYFCDFTQSDWSFWWSQISFGAYDHRWPAEQLVRQERQRYVGSSDACFICEVTEWDKNVPHEIDKKQLGMVVEDAFWANNFHNGINRQTLVTFRGE